MLSIPRAPMACVFFEGQPPQNKTQIPIKRRVIWVLGIHIIDKMVTLEPLKPTSSRHEKRHGNWVYKYTYDLYCIII